MHNYPVFAPKQTSARIDFLRQGERLVDRKGTYYVKFLAENWTKTIMPHIHMWVMPQKARTLATSSAGGCRAGHARPTKSASCKGRGMLPSTAGFQLVENTRNDFNQSPLLMHNHVLPHTNGAAISQQRLELENHFLSATTAQRCHALKLNKHTNCP